MSDPARRGAPLPPDETERLALLEAYEVLDTQDDPYLDRIVGVAARISGAPIALVSLVDADRQWFKACIGLDVRETEREVAFCAHAILAPSQQLVIEDATADPRFADNPLVTGPPYIRAYAGTPLVVAPGRALGTLCVIDTRPRPFDEDVLAILRELAELVVDRLDQRVATTRLRDAVLEDVHLRSTEASDVARSVARTLAAYQTTEDLPAAWAQVIDGDTLRAAPDGAPRWPQDVTSVATATGVVLRGLDEVPERLAAALRTAGVGSLLEVPLRHGDEPFAVAVFGYATGQPQPDARSRVLLVTQRLEAAFAQARSDEARTAAERESLRHAAELQTARAMDDVRRRVSTSLGHHLRTPLAVLRSAAVQLADAHGDEREELIAAIQRNTTRLDRLLEDMLDVMLDVPRATDELQVTDLRDLVVSRVQASDLTHVDLALEPVSARVAPDRIERLLDALLENVAEHTPDGTGTRIELVRDDGSVRLIVADQGPGMPGDLKSRAFLPFEHGNEHGHVPGVGLGLALVAAVAQVHGGRAWAEDGTGGGARVVVELPVEGPPRTA